MIRTPMPLTTHSVRFDQHGDVIPIVAHGHLAANPNRYVVKMRSMLRTRSKLDAMGKFLQANAESDRAIDCPSVDRSARTAHPIHHTTTIIRDIDPVQVAARRRGKRAGRLAR